MGIKCNAVFKTTAFVLCGESRPSKETIRILFYNATVGLFKCCINLDSILLPSPLFKTYTGNQWLTQCKRNSLSIQSWPKDIDIFVGKWWKKECHQPLYLYTQYMAFEIC